MKFNNETLRIAVKEWLKDETTAEAKYSHISDWDTSEVTDMSKLFLDAHTFNEPLNNWDVSNVTDMESMFYGANSFNQPIGDWDVSKVTSMRCMFFEAISFNRSIGDWDTLSVTDMSCMFQFTTFNKPIGDWDVSKVSSMRCMFFEAISFNRSIGDWNTSSVTDMSEMFSKATSFNQPIGDWDVSNVTDVSEMFGGDYATLNGDIAFNQDIGSWKLKERIDHDIEHKGTLFFTLKDGSEISISVERHALIDYSPIYESGIWYMSDDPNFLDSMFLTTSVTPQSIIEIADIKKLFDYDTYDGYDWNGSGGGDCKTLKEWNDFKSKLSRVTSKDQLYFKKQHGT
jgi:surface protein